MVSSEVSRGRSKPATSSGKPGRSHNKDEGLNVRIGGSNQDVYVTGVDNRNASARYLCEDKPEAESKLQEELSLHMQPMRHEPGTCLPSGRESFF
jgi:hypothetical protein